MDRHARNFAVVGAKLEAALEQARVDGAGVEARKLSHHNQCMCTVS